MELLFYRQIKVLTLDEEKLKKGTVQRGEYFKKKKCCALPNILVVPNWRMLPVIVLLTYYIQGCHPTK